MIEKNRNTGRTSRIVDFTIDQLLSIGEVIITDHVCYEFKNQVNHTIHFTEYVKFRYDLLKYPKILQYEIITVNNIKLIHFKLV